MSARTIEGWRFDSLRFVLLVGAWMVFGCFLMAALVRLNEEGLVPALPSYLPPIIRAFAGFYAVLGSALLTVGASFAFARWVYERSDDRVRRMLSLGAFSHMPSRRRRGNRTLTEDASDAP